MPLRFDLGPFEKLFIGKSILTNNGGRTSLVIEGDTPVLRARDVLPPEQAANALERIYCCVQQMYLEEDAAKYHSSYLAAVAQTMSEFPDCSNAIADADRLIKSNQHYKALRELKKLIEKHAGGTQRIVAASCSASARI
jgi:flagellar biosynthesis repressor protein FlbT